MQRNLLLLGFYLMLLPATLFGQNQWTISGTLTDKNTGETLIGASILLPALDIGTSTNAYGFYSLEVNAEDSVLVQFSYVGYQSLEKKLLLKNDLLLNIELASGMDLTEVTVKANSFQEQMNSTQMSVEQISTREVKLIPVLLGESDILKSIQLKPGIPSGAEGTTGLFVRGGGSDQNLILLDEAVVYNANHLFGFFSTFNTDAVKDLKLYKGGFPAEYGGRLSSVIDVKLKDGNNKKFSGSGGLGIISSRLTLEGPIQKDKSSFIVSGRRTYVDIFTRMLNRANEDNEDFSPIPDYFFYDLNTKLNFKLGEKDHLYISGYFGRDVFGFDGDFFDFDFDWGNTTGTLRWNHVFNPKLFSNTSVTFSDYQYNIRNKITGFSLKIGSAIQDVTLRSDYYLSLNNKHQFKMGVSSTFHQFEIGRLRAGSDDGEISFSAGQNFEGLEFGFYFSDEMELSKKVKLNAGLRWSGFITDQRTFFGLEPRLAAKYSLNNRWVLKASYARMFQYLHLVSTSSGFALPTDIWYPSTRAVRPQSSDQFAVGFSHLFGSGIFLNWEAYYKFLDNQLEFVDGAEIFANDNLEEEFAIGRGEGYGMEISIEKKEGNFTGWIGYTLAFIQRGDFETIDPLERFAQQGYFSPIYDRRHDISVVAMYEMGERWTATATFVYGSGDLRWLPSGRFTFQDINGANFESVVPDYFGDRNNFRFPPYHRLDVGLVYNISKNWNKGESDITLNVINVYDRRNTFFIYLEPEFEVVEDDNGNTFEVPRRISARQVSLFPIIPSLTWNFKF